MKYNCVIIDDDAKAIEHLTYLIILSLNLQLTAAYQSPIQAVELMNKEQDIDLLFLDIEMGNISGLDLFPAIRQLAKHIVIVTGHSKYAIKAFQVSADQFLLKPFNEIHFFTVINHIMGKSKEQKFKDASKLFYIRVQNKKTFMQINVDDIIAVEAAMNYVTIHTFSNTVVAYHSLKEMHESLLEFPDFMKIHKSFIINTKLISTIDADTVKMENKLVIPIAESQKQAIRTFIRERTFISRQGK